jgi:sporulation protein YlmC with PRC-barrel domain
MTGRQLYAALHLLDHQLVDRSGRFCGNVDDLEIDVTPEGVHHVVAIIAGPGALLYRLGGKRPGRWLRTHVGNVFGASPDPDRIPMRQVSDIGSTIRVSADRYELGTGATEIWVRDHVIGHIPGSRHDADE